MSKLRKMKNNPNKGTKGNEYIARSLQELGAARSIVATADGEVIAGNHVLEQAEKLGIPTRVVQTDGTELVVVQRTDVESGSDKAMAIAVADNKATELNLEWDEELLSIMADDVGSWTNNDNIFPAHDPSAEVKEDDFDPDAHYETKVKAGEVWQLGEHRLMCGDSTDADAVAKLMNGERADLVFTDPPYGMKKESEGVLNDNLNFDDLLEFNKRWIPLTFANLKDNGSWYCWGIDEPLMDIYSNILRPMQKRNEITFRNLITWDKKTGQGQNSEGFRMYAIADEKCLFCQCGVQAQNPNQDQYWDKVEPLRAYLEEQRNKCGWDIPTMKTIAGHSDLNRDHWTGKSQWSLIPEYVYKKFQAWAKEHKIEAFTRPYQSLKDEYERLCAYFNNTHDNMNNVWHFDRTSAEEREGLDHATPKPLALCARGIKSSSREGEIVLDLFGGSGSTMIACEQLGRKCRMMELDPHYCTVIIARWEKLTGKKALLL